MIARSWSIVLIALALGNGADVGAADASRGRLLYETVCMACHSRQVHWRDQRLATDLASLTGQVRRWAGVAGSGWTESEIQDVVRYLDETIYRFPAR